MLSVSVNEKRFFLKESKILSYLSEVSYGERVMKRLILTLLVLIVVWVMLIQIGQATRNRSIMNDIQETPTMAVVAPIEY